MATNDRAIGEAVRLLRGGRSQRAIAAAMKTRGWSWSQSTVWEVESGRRSLRLSEAVDLAAELGVTVDYLIPPTPPTATEPAPAVRDYIRALVDQSAASARVDEAMRAAKASAVAAMTGVLLAQHELEQQERAEKS